MLVVDVIQDGSFFIAAVFSSIESCAALCCRRDVKILDRTGCDS